MTTITIPNNELAQFMQLPVDVRQEVQSWHYELSNASKPIRLWLKSVAARMGVSVQTAERKYYAWRKNPSWRALINRAKVPEDRGALSPEFLEYWRGLCEKNGRKCKPAYRQFLREFKNGAVIPGIDPKLNRSTLPSGYSYDNLNRYRPTDFELTASRIGRGAAAVFRPKVFTTRVGMSVGQRYIFDDLWHDFKVVMVGQRRAMRLLQLHAHDLYSGCQFARGLKPRMEAADGTSIGLKENEMLFLVAHVLAEFGFHPDGCVLMVEHGTASIRDELEKQIFELTNGRVTVERSGIEGVSSFAGQYAGRGKGNYRFKAALESLGNLIHNETANLMEFPGQTGSNSRINAPEELHGRERHADALLRAIVALPVERAAMLRLPFLEVNQARWLVEAIMERINQRTDHELEGWLEAGLTTTDMEIPGVGIMPAHAFLALPADKQAALQAIAVPFPRRMSPREVFVDGQMKLSRMRPEQSAALLHMVAGREVVVAKDHLIEFEDQTISPEPLRYLAHHFAPGDKFSAVVNPMSPDVAHLFDARGGWVGAINAWRRISRDDVAGLHRQMGEAAAVERQLLAPVAARGAELTRQRLADAQHNAEVLAADRTEFKPAKSADADCTADLLARDTE